MAFDEPKTPTPNDYHIPNYNEWVEQQHTEPEPEDEPSSEPTTSPFNITSPIPYNTTISSLPPPPTPWDDLANVLLVIALIFVGAKL